MLRFQLSLLLILERHFLIVSPFLLLKVNDRLFNLRCINLHYLFLAYFNSFIDERNLLMLLTRQQHLLLAFKFTHLSPQLVPTLLPLPNCHPCLSVLSLTLLRKLLCVQLDKTTRVQ